MFNRIEKRKSIRAEKPFVLELRIKADENREKAYDDWNTVYARNLSAGGVSLYYIMELEVGSIVELKIHIPKSTSSINCIGKVMRSGKNPKSPLNEIAISFTEIDEQKKEMINKILEESI